MRKQLIRTLNFPLKGLDENWAYKEQPRDSSVDVLNMRAHSPVTGRARGAQRPGLRKYLSAQIDQFPVQDLNHVVTVQDVATVVTALNLRTITPVAVVSGSVYSFTTTAATVTIGGSGALDGAAPVVFSAQLFDTLYFADGSNYKKFNAPTLTTSTWTATAGSLPISGGNTPRLIERWRGRIVLSGISTDPHNWFMSKVGVATDFDYSPTDQTAIQAVAGNNSPAGLIGDVINALIPYNDDILIFLCDHSIYQMTGDPMDGGRIDQISDVIGGAFGRSWCKDSLGTVYFFGSRGGVYRMRPGAVPERISAQRIEKRLQSVNLNTTIVRMVWDDEQIGFHLFLTSLADAAGQSFFWDARNDGWWRDSFQDDTYQPRAVHILDGDSPSDRVVLLGSENGHVRAFDGAVKNDDEVAIDSYVQFGPIIIDDGSQPFVFTELQAVFSRASSNVAYEVFVGPSVEQALLLTVDTLLALEDGDTLLLEDGDELALEQRFGDFEGTLAPIRAYSEHPRLRAYAAFIRLRNGAKDETWEFEAMRVFLSVPKTSRRRVFD